MTTFDIRKSLTILVTVGSLAAAGTAFAQAQGQGQAYPPQQPPGEIGSSELQAFAEAQQEVVEINQEYQEKAQSAEDPAEIAQIREEVNERMVQAVRNAGLEPDEYNAIASAVQADPELAARLRDLQ